MGSGGIDSGSGLVVLTDFTTDGTDIDLPKSIRVWIEDISDMADGAILGLSNEWREDTPEGRRSGPYSSMNDSSAPDGRGKDDWRLC